MFDNTVTSGDLFFLVFLWWIVDVIRNYPHKDNSPERKEINRLKAENETLMAPILDVNTINHMEYMANDPDLELFKAKCRARGEVF